MKEKSKIIWIWLCCLSCLIGTISARADDDDIMVRLAEIQRQITEQKNELVRVNELDLSAQRDYSGYLAREMNSSPGYFKDQIAKLEKGIAQFEIQGSKAITDERARYSRLESDKRNPETLRRNLEKIKEFTDYGVERRRQKSKEYADRQTEFESVHANHQANMAEYDKELSDIAAKISRLREQYDDLHLTQVMQHYPMTVDGVEIPTFHPPYLRSVVVTSNNGETYYSASWTGPDSLIDKELVLASNELLKLKAYRKEMLKNIDQIEKDFVRTTNKYVNLLTAYGNGVIDRAVVNTYISAIAVILKTKGNIVSVGVELVEKGGKALIYAAKGNTAISDFSVKIPNYPEELLQYRESMKGDPVALAKEELEKIKEHSPNIPEGDNLASEAELGVLNDLAWWGIKKAVKTGGKESLKWGLRNYGGQWALREAVLKQLKATTGASQLKNLGIDFGAAAYKGLHETLVGTDAKFVEAGWVELEWFALRKQYHFENAKLREFYKIYEKAIKEFDKLYKDSLTKPSRRQLLITTDRVIKTGDYKLHLEFSHEVHIRKLLLDDAGINRYPDGVVGPNGGLHRPETLDKVLRKKYYPLGTPREDQYYSQYDIEFHYELSRYSPRPVNSDDYRIPIEVVAADRDDNMLDGDPANVPLYHPLIVYHAQANGKPSAKVFEDITDRWWHYEGDRSIRYPKSEDNHKLKKFEAIMLKATLKDAKPITIEVR